MIRKSTINVWRKLTMSCTKEFILTKTFCENISCLWHVTSMANHCIHFLQQNLVTPDQETRLQCLKTIGCPTVKYVSSFWDPVGNKQLQCQLEQEQKKAGGMNPTGIIKAVLVTRYRTLACTEFLSCQKRNCTSQNVAQHLL